MSTIKTPGTVRELGDLAHAAGATPSEYLERMSPSEYHEMIGGHAFRTPQPEWATSTESVSTTHAGDPICSHLGELFDVAEVSVAIVREDILTNGKVTIGETKVVLLAADQLEVDADALAAIGQNMIDAAERVREVLK